MLHCARNADYYGGENCALLKKKKSICIHSACKKSLRAVLAAAPAAFEFLTSFFKPFWHAIHHTSSRNLYYPLWGNCPCSKSEIITKTISIQCKSNRSWRQMKSNSWSNSRREAPCGCWPSWGHPVLKMCLARPECN